MFPPRTRIGTVHKIARRFGRQRVILWGGVYSDNAAGLKYYRKAGFGEIGRLSEEYLR